MKTVKNTMKTVKNTIDVILDFDGTCVTHEYPRIGHDIGSVSVLKELVAQGHRLILFTMRSNSKQSLETFNEFNGLQEAVNWFNKHNIPLYGIQTNPTQKHWTTSPKAYGQLIIDDTSLGIPLKYDGTYSNRFHVDWTKTRELLVERNLIPRKTYKEQFEEFIQRVHPDPDSLLVGDNKEHAYNELIKLSEKFHKNNE